MEGEEDAQAPKSELDASERSVEARCWTESPFCFDTAFGLGREEEEEPNVRIQQLFDQEKKPLFTKTPGINTFFAFEMDLEGFLRLFLRCIRRFRDSLQAVLDDTFSPDL